MSVTSIKVCAHIPDAKAAQDEDGVWEIRGSQGRGKMDYVVWGMGSTEEQAWQNAKENLDL